MQLLKFKGTNKGKVKTMLTMKNNNENKNK